MPVAGVGSGPGRVLLLHPVVPLAWMGLPPVQMPLPGTETPHDTLTCWSSFPCPLPTG